jgi:hypothetical protein
MQFYDSELAERMLEEQQPRRRSRNTRETDGENVSFPRKSFNFYNSRYIKYEMHANDQDQNNSEYVECSICYENNKDNIEKLFLITECKHAFCTGCLTNWAKKNCKHYREKGFYTTCPCCRGNIKCGEDYTDLEKAIAKIKHILRLKKTYNNTMPVIQSLIDKMNAKDLKSLAGHSILNKIDNVDLTLEEIKLTGKNKAQLQTSIRYRIGELYKLYSLTHRGH